MHREMNQNEAELDASKGEMKAITVRNLPPAVAKAVREKAKKERMSLNRAVVSLLEQATGQTSKPTRRVLHHDLDRFAGSWTREEAAEFDAYLKEQRPIDDEVWK
jgi:hypothetical protein